MTHVLVEQRGPALLITINRPDKRNALNPEATDALKQAFSRLDDEPSALVGVLTGAAGCFSAGMDLATFLDGAMFDERLVRDARPHKPLVAAVEGFALAGGLELMLICDLVVASRTARFGLPEVTRGIFAAAGGLVRLPHRLPLPMVMHLALTGEPIDAETAHHHGLVNVLTEPGQAQPAGLALAGQIAANGPLAVRASKELVLLAAEQSEDEVWARQQDLVDSVFTSAEAAEGSRAFLERRAPDWQTS